MEGEDGGEARLADFASVITAATGACCIADDQGGAATALWVAGGDSQQFVHRGGEAVHVDREDGAGARGDFAFHVGWVEFKRLLDDVAPDNLAAVAVG